MNVDEIKDMSVWTLAGNDHADCFDPDTDHSSGAVFLRDVRDAFVEAWTEGRFDGKDDGSVIHEIADDAPDIYTANRWRQFTDLGAWQEEPEHGEWPEDLTDTAGVALYQIAERLCYRLLDDLREEVDDDADDDDPSSGSDQAEPAPVERG